MERSITAEQELNATHLAIALRSLRKWGFYVVQDPDASTRAQDFQECQAAEAACHLVCVDATKENMVNFAIRDLTQALLQNSDVGIERLRGRI